MPSVTGFQLASMRLSGVRRALERGVPTVPVSGSVPVPLARLSDVLLRAGTGGRSVPCASSCASPSVSTDGGSGAIGERGGGGLPSRGTGGLIIRMGGLNGGPPKGGLPTGGLPPRCVPPSNGWSLTVLGAGLCRALAAGPTTGPSAPGLGSGVGWVELASSARLGGKCPTSPYWYGFGSSLASIAGRSNGSGFDSRHAARGSGEKASE
jgi:hypothetical protein